MSDDLRITPSPIEEGKGKTDSDRESDSAAALDRLLPPPAFTPGQRREVVHRHLRGSSIESLVANFGMPEDALISPDAPPRIRSALPTFLPGEEQEDEVDGEVTGIGESGSPYFDSGRPSLRERLETEEAAQVLEKVARFLREDGPASLLKLEGRSGFEAMLRGFVAGYYIGGREE